MDILYISNTTSPTYFEQIYDISRIKPGQQVQKFNHMLLRGFSEKNNIHAVSAVPATNATCSKAYFPNKKELENGIHYHYSGFINFPIIKQLCVKINTRVHIRKWVRQKHSKNRVIICYALSPTLSAVALKMAKKYHIQCMAVVTDIPALMNVEKHTGGLKQKIYDVYAKSTFYKMTQYDMYMLLTTAMGDVINPHQKPNIIIEGMVDFDMVHSNNTLENKYHPKVVLYAGALFEKYGVKHLIEGFVKANIKNCELWLFGSGEMEDYVSSIDNDSVKYFGVVPNKDVVTHEIHATLLVNPRPSTQEFTKYSFPSKNMEYMMSGTPVLTCALPGIPDEYLEYVYIIRDESSKGFCNALTKLLSQKPRTLHSMGRKAKTFVTENKTNSQQAEKIVAFINDHL